MRFTHHSYNSNSTGSSDRLSFKEWSEFIFIVFGDSTNNLDKFGCFGYSIFLGGFADKIMEMDFIPLFIVLDDEGDDFRDILEVKNILIDFFFLPFFWEWLLNFNHC